MPRYSNDPKETTIKLRLNEKMREHIEKYAKRNGISMSEYLRKIITQDMQSKKIIR
jgi:predicted DNA binding CopG/RHH family protein